MKHVDSTSQIDNKNRYDKCLSLFKENSFIQNLVIEDAQLFKIKSFYNINTSDYSFLSSGEKILVRFWCDQWEGSGNVTINELKYLDSLNRKNVIKLINRD